MPVAAIASAVLLLALGAAVLISANQTPQDADKAPPLPRVGRLGIQKLFFEVGCPPTGLSRASPVTIELTRSLMAGKCQSALEDAPANVTHLPF